VLGRVRFLVLDQVLVLVTDHAQIHVLHLVTFPVQLPAPSGGPISSPSGAPSANPSISPTSGPRALPRAPLLALHRSLSRAWVPALRRLHRRVQYSTVQYSTVQYSTVVVTQSRVQIKLPLHYNI
jgi:hypothetical protein